MESYMAPHISTVDDLHYVRIHFQYGEHKATIEADLGGNIYGGEIIASSTDFSGGLTVPIENDFTKKHAVLFEESDNGMHHTHREVEYLKLLHPTRDPEVISVHEAQHYIVGVEIYKYEHEGLLNEV